MEIKQLQYFCAIVESHFNLSAASKKLHISQPALSQMIKTFEEEENIILFERSNGRLQNLTAVGENFYKNAQNVIEQYQYMIEQVREASSKMKGKIKIGIPPLVISVVFSKIITELIINNPDIKFEVIEIGAYELRKSLLLQEVDIAILLRPTKMSQANVEEKLLAVDELCAFMDIDNPLAKSKKLDWEQLNDQPLAIFDHTFMIHHKVNKQLEFKKVKPKISLMSASWDFLFRSTKGTNIITILPAPVSDYYPDPNIVKVPFHLPLNWEIVACRCKKTHYNNIEKYVYNSILEFFNTEK
jgi:DNA-binding transcriptional LysR family regulator